MAQFRPSPYSFSQLGAVDPAIITSAIEAGTALTAAGITVAQKGDAAAKAHALALAKAKKKKKVVVRKVDPTANLLAPTPAAWSVPLWAYILGGVGIVGGIAWFVLRKKGVSPAKTEGEA